MNTLTYNFLAHRIYCVSGGKMHIPLSIVVASLGSLGSGLAYSADNLKYRLVDQTMFSNVSAQLSPRMGISVYQVLISRQSNAISFFAFQMACDILITAGMVYYLYQCRGLIKRTNSVINILAFYSVNCGAINMICVAASLACVCPFDILGQT
ncbi:hypothetical protein BC834DRAFT_908266 [Gloeopeniophorella convolvens]|nr:hypothetical protein BC834DRAFT_908266 [Gloeopeniophorella convolvens]